MYDFSEPPVFAVDDDGQVFTSQVASNNPVVCSQDTSNVQTGKEITLSDSDDDAEFDMGDFADSLEIRMKEQAEVDEILEEMRKQKEDPMTHCQGDTDIEDVFVSADEAAAEPATEPVHAPEKRNKLSVKRK